jgi:hypothetical protein
LPNVCIENANVNKKVNGKGPLRGHLLLQQLAADSGRQPEMTSATASSNLQATTACSTHGSLQQGTAGSSLQPISATRSLQPVEASSSLPLTAVGNNLQSSTSGNILSGGLQEEDSSNINNSSSNKQAEAAEQSSQLQEKGEHCAGKVYPFDVFVLILGSIYADRWAV